MNLGEGFVEEFDGDVDVGFGGVEHGGEAERVAVKAAFANEKTVLAGALHDLGGGFGSGLFGFAVFDEFQSLHQAHTADVADERVLLLKLFELAAEVIANDVGVFAEVFFFDEVDGGFGGDAGDGIAAEGGDVSALVAGCDFRSGDSEADRNAVGHTFGTGDEVGRDLPLFDAEPFFTGAAPTGLDFVGDEKAAVFFYDFEDYLEIFLWGSDEAADALNGFGDEGGDVAAGGGLDEIFDVVGACDFAVGIFEVKRAAVAVGINSVGDANADDTCFAVRRVGGDSLGERRAAGVGVAECDDVVAAGGHAGEQDGGLVGFAAGVGEETLLQVTGSDVGDFFGECDDVFVGVEGGGVLESMHLSSDFIGNLWIAVADGDGEDAAEKVEVFVSLDVIDILHFAPVGYERLLKVVGDRGPEIFFVLGDNVFAT